MKTIRSAWTRLRLATAWQAEQGGSSAAIGTPIRLAQGRLRSLPHSKPLARQTDAFVFLIEGDGKLAEDPGADRGRPAFHSHGNFDRELWHGIVGMGLLRVPRDPRDDGGQDQQWSQESQESAHGAFHCHK